MPSLKDALKLTEQQARCAFGAARAVIEADGAAKPHGAQLLVALARALALTGDWRSMPAASPSEAAMGFSDPKARKHLSEALVIAACIEGEVTLAGETTVESFAAALEVRSKWVGLLLALRKRRVLAVKRALVSGSPDAKRIFARTWAEEGFGGLWTVLTFLLGVHRDPVLAARFRKLGELPEGTLGKTFYEHLDGRGLTFPGERGGLPERMIHHDLMHVVNGYGTDPAGECELAGFYAGYCGRFGFDDAFTFFVTVLATFQFGMPVSPAIVTPARGAFDPERVLASFLRGLALQVDVMGPWDYWALMPLSVADACVRLGIAEPQVGSAVSAVPSTAVSDA